MYAVAERPQREQTQQPQIAADTAERARIQQLEAQILELEKKLGELHGSDLVAIRRAYTSLSNHARALKYEAAGVPGLIKQFDTALITPEFVAQEASLIAGSTASVYLVDRGLRLMRIPGAGLVTQFAAIAMAGILGWRLIKHSGMRLVRLLKKNEDARRLLIQEWQAIEQRIDIMASLADTGLESAYKAQAKAADAAKVI